MNLLRGIKELESVRVDGTSLLHTELFLRTNAAGSAVSVVLKIQVDLAPDDGVPRVYWSEADMNL